MHIFHFLLDHRLGGPHAYVKMLTKHIDAEFSSKVFTTGHWEYNTVVKNIFESYRILNVK